VIGGEGSGGVIFPELHYGRDALVGIALTLQHLTDYGKSISSLKNELPQYYIVKKKIEVTKDPDEVFKKLINQFSGQQLNIEDGLRVDFTDHWVHFRKSNTEPIIRIIVEAKTEAEAKNFSEQYLKLINS
jgi:phosphomannomutase